MKKQLPAIILFILGCISMLLCLVAPEGKEYIFWTITGASWFAAVPVAAESQFN